MFSTARKTMSTTYERKVIIVGKTGNGKSSLGNTLLEREAFFAADDFNAVTKVCQLDENISRITVVDTPGLFDTMEADTNVKRIKSNALSILQSLDICCKPHAFLFTLNGACRLTDEELSVIDVLRIIFGNEWTDHAIVVVTHVDNDVKESDFTTKWTKCEKLKEFVKECNGRICRIDNKYPKKEHVGRIMDNVNQVSQNGARPFSTEYSECRKNVLQNEEKLDDYNGMPTHLIIKHIAMNIENSISEEIRKQDIYRQEMKERREKQQAELIRQRNKTIRNAAIYTATGLTATAVSCAVKAVPAVALGFCSGGAGVAIFAAICAWSFLNS